MRIQTAALIGISVVLLVAGLVWPLGFFTIDETIYVQGADVFRESGGFVFSNGYDRFGSDHLFVQGFLPLGPNGQTTQYPPGTSILGAWAMALYGDLRGMLFLNVLATIGSLFVTRRIALDLFGSQTIAFWATLLFICATFVAEYAFAFWPHMISVLTVSLSFLWFWHALQSPPRALFLAFASGLALGAGMLFRLDNILLLPLIGVATILYAASLRHVAMIGLGGLAGLAPAVAALSLINAGRYGTYNPLSYGPSVEGGASLSTYIPVLALGVVLLLGLILFRLSADRVGSRVWLAIAAASVLLAWVLSPQAQNGLSAYLKGALDLMVDAKLIVDTRIGVETDENGIILFWGLSKKALGQSMPWLGVLAALIGLTWGDKRRSITLILLLTFLWTLPFMIQSWHGGAGSNMRYFMPILPMLSALGAWVIARLAKDAPQSHRILFAGGFLGAMLCVFWTVRTETSLEGVHQILSSYVLYGVAAASLAVALYKSDATRSIALLVAGIGLGTAMFNTVSDVMLSKVFRDTTAPLSDLAQGYDGEVLVYGYMLRSALVNDGQFLALTDEKRFDASLVDQALDEGVAIKTRKQLAEGLIANRPDLTMIERSDDPFGLIDVVRKGDN